MHTQEEKTAVAYLNALKSSPLKVMKLTRNLPGLPVAEVLMKLKFCNLLTISNFGTVFEY